MSTITSVDNTEPIDIDRKINASALKQAQAKLQQNKLKGGFGTIEYAQSPSDARKEMRASFDEVLKTTEKNLPSFALGETKNIDSVIDALDDFLVTRNDHDKQNVKLFRNICNNVISKIEEVSSETNNPELFDVFGKDQGKALDLLLNYTYRRSEAFKKAVVDTSERGNLLDLCGVINLLSNNSGRYIAYQEENTNKVRTSLLKYYSAIKRADAEGDEDFWKMPVEWQVDFGG